MENQLPQSTVPTIWETNPKLKTLLLVLIFVFLFSGIGLTAFSVWGNNYRQKVYEETKAGLPVHTTNNIKDLNNNISSPDKSMFATGTTISTIQGWSAYNGITAYGGETYYYVQYPSSWKLEDDNLLKKNTCVITLGAGGHGLEGSKFIKDFEIVSADGNKTKVVVIDSGSTLEAYVNFNDYYIFEYATDKKSDCLDEYVEIVKTVKIGKNALENSWKAYRNVEYGFEFNYPNYFKPVNNLNSDILTLSTLAGKDNLRLSFTDKLEGYEFENAPGGFVCKYNIKNKTWSTANTIDQKYCPSLISNTDNTTSYITAIGDGAGILDIAYIPMESRNSFLQVFLSHGFGDACEDKLKCPNDYPITDTETLKQILGTFKFTK